MKVFIRKKKKKKSNLNEYYVDVIYDDGKRINRKLGIYADKKDNRKTIRKLDNIKKVIMKELDSGLNIDDILNRNNLVYKNYKVLPYIKKISKNISVNKVYSLLDSLRSYSKEFIKNNTDFTFEDIDRNFIINYSLFLRKYFSNDEVDIMIKGLMNILSYAVRDKMAIESDDWKLTEEF